MKLEVKGRGEDEEFESIAADFSNPHTPEQIVKKLSPALGSSMC